MVMPEKSDKVMMGFCPPRFALSDVGARGQIEGSQVKPGQVRLGRDVF